MKNFSHPPPWFDPAVGNMDFAHFFRFFTFCSFFERFLDIFCGFSWFLARIFTFFHFFARNFNFFQFFSTFFNYFFDFFNYFFDFFQSFFQLFLFFDFFQGIGKFFRRTIRPRGQFFRNNSSLRTIIPFFAVRMHICMTNCHQLNRAQRIPFCKRTL